MKIIENSVPRPSKYRCFWKPKRLKPPAICHPELTWAVLANDLAVRSTFLIPRPLFGVMHIHIISFCICMYMFDMWVGLWVLRSQQD